MIGELPSLPQVSSDVSLNSYESDDRVKEELQKGAKLFIEVVKAESRKAPEEDVVLKQLSFKRNRADRDQLLQIDGTSSLIRLYLQRPGSKTLHPVKEYPAFIGSYLGPKARPGDNISPEGLATVGELKDSQYQAGRAIVINWGQSSPVPIEFHGLNLKAERYDSTGCVATIHIEALYEFAEIAKKNGNMNDPIKIFMFPFEMNRLKEPAVEAAIYKSEDYKNYLPFWKKLEEMYTSIHERKMEPVIDSEELRTSLLIPNAQPPSPSSSSPPSTKGSAVGH